jgi:hypothetical protein
VLFAGAAGVIIEAAQPGFDPDIGIRARNMKPKSEIDGQSSPKEKTKSPRPNDRELIPPFGARH